MTDTRRIGTIMTLMAWFAVLMILTWAASIFLEREQNPNHSPETRVNAYGAIEVTLWRNRAGHYVATGAINRQPVQFLLDTGATLVAIDEELADELDLQRGMEQPLQTANGMVRGYRTLLKSVSVGEIELTGVPAVIMPDLDGQVLLGMSFLKRLTLVQQGDTLLLRKN